MSNAILFLNKQADRRIKRGHPWLYSNEVDNERSPLKSFAAGDIVELRSAGGDVLGLLMLNPHALICGRLLARDVSVTIDTKFFVQRIRSAVALRELCFPKSFYRAVYGDSDALPGLVVDRFDDVLVVQFATAGMEKLRMHIESALDEVFAPKGIVFRNDHSARSLENLADEIDIVGSVPEYLTVEENDTQFRVSARQGQKTGWFYDHRLNRRFLQGLVAGKSVLDVFSYVGAWGLQAAMSGAKSLCCVDASQEALALCEDNAALNGLAEKVRCMKGKAVEVMKASIAAGEKYDVVVLDPPAFIKKRKDQNAGEKAYRHINELALRLLSPGGILVSASCSMPLNNDTLTDIVRGASHHLDRRAQLFHIGAQGPDHPIHPAVPETQYIKAQFYRVD